MKTSYVEIEGPSSYVDAYKKMAFNGKGTMSDVIKFVEKNESVNEEFKSKDSTFEKVYGIFDKRDYFNNKGFAKTQIGNFERALQKKDKGAQQILDKFKGDVNKAKDYIFQVLTDRRKEESFNDYKAFKAAVDSIQKGKPIPGAVDLVKRRIHNNSQKYTMALYSTLRNQKFNKWKDIHTDVDSLIGESLNEAFLVAYGKREGNKSIKPAFAAYADKKMAQKFMADMKKDGYKVMMTQKKIRGVDESVNEASKEAMGIAGFTGTRGVAVDDFIKKNKIDARKLFNFVRKGNLRDRMDFVTAIAGKPNNKFFKMIVGRFAESINEVLVIVDKFDKKRQDYGKIYYQDGGNRPGDGDIKKANKELAKLSKKHKGLTLVSVGRNSKMYDVNNPRESVNESFFVMYQKKGVFGKPAAVKYKDKKTAEKFAKDLERDGYNTMILDRQTMRNVKGVKVTESKNKESKAIQVMHKYSKTERKFYDKLADHERRIGPRDYKRFIEKALRGFGLNPNKFKTIPDAEEKMYQIVVKESISEDLRKWFGKGKTGSSTGGGWDRYSSTGKKLGKCGDGKEGGAYAACLSKEKAAKLGAKGRAAFVRRKRADQKKSGDAKKGGNRTKGKKPTFSKTGT